MSVLSDRLLEELVELVAAEVASRVAAALEPAPPTLEAGGPWRLLSLVEAAERLGRSERWVRERVKRGELATVRLDGGALAFDVDDLRAFAAARRVGPGQAEVLAGRLQDGRESALGAGSRGSLQPSRLRVER